MLPDGIFLNYAYRFFLYFQWGDFLQFFYLLINVEHQNNHFTGDSEYNDTDDSNDYTNRINKYAKNTADNR